MTELVKYIACQLVDHPDQVQVNEVQGEQARLNAGCRRFRASRRSSWSFMSRRKIWAR